MSTTLPLGPGNRDAASLLCRSMFESAPEVPAPRVGLPGTSGSTQLFCRKDFPEVSAGPWHSWNRLPIGASNRDAASLLCRSMFEVAPEAPAPRAGLPSVSGSQQLFCRSMFETTPEAPTPRVELPGASGSPQLFCRKDFPEAVTGPWHPWDALPIGVDNRDAAQLLCRHMFEPEPEPGIPAGARLAEDGTPRRLEDGTIRTLEGT